jgi:hypothetical protein
MSTKAIKVFRMLLLGLLLLGAASVVRAQTTPLSDLDALRYIASHPDLIAAFGPDAAKGRSHYETWGIKEGRKITFNPLNYIASHPDLIAAFGADAAKGVRHYIQNGHAERRQITFDPNRYMASYPDLIQAFAGDETKAARHYIEWGYKEQRQTTFSDLSALQYIASFTDLMQAFGTDVIAGIRHYVTAGYREGRKITFDALAYIASYGDLIAAFGTNALSGVQHYINWGFREGRQVVFDALGYLSRYTDLQQAFGSDTVAATKHYINWGFREGRTYSLTVSVKVTGPGTASTSRVFINPGERASVTLSPAEGGYLASVSGCGGSLRGKVFTTNPVIAACEINATFRSAVGSIQGRIAAFDPALPAYVTVVSAADDSVLVSAPVDSSGSFSIDGLDDRKDYIVEFEQQGVAPAGAVVDYGSNRRVTKNDESLVEQVLSFFGIQFSERVSPSAVVAQVGDRVTFDTSKVKGLSENEFYFKWESNETVSGLEVSSYVPQPIKVDPIPLDVKVGDPQAAVRLAEEYGILLLDPANGESSSSTQLKWTSEYADRLLQLLKIMPLPVASESVRGWSKLTYVELVNSELENDLAKVSGVNYLGGRIRISRAAFTYATPQLARVEGKRGIFFSNRLFRVVLRIVTQDGTRRDVVRDLMKQRYGITVATDDNDALLIVPATCSTEIPSDCLDAEWKVFNPEEFFDLLSILEEFPEGMRDLSQPGKAIGLRHLLRRRDGVPHPLYPQAPAVAWPEFGYAEFMESGFRGTRSNRHSLIVHEKAHFIWAGLLSSAQRYDWLRLSGWHRVPKLESGTDVKTVGKCDQWQSNPNQWIPPNVLDSDAEFVGAVRHDDDQTDTVALKRDWASCSSVQFVSDYAAKVNPNEDFAESVSAFLLNPDLLRSRALPKYEFIRDRLMQGSIYLSKIRQDLTFEVFNLYPDYTYPGKIKSVEIKVTGGPNDDKTATFRIALHVSENCDSKKNPGCFQGASRGGFRVFSRVNTFYDVGLSPVTPAGDVLEGTLTLSKYAASGWWQVVSIVLFDAVGTTRISKQSSKDFGWKMYVNNPLEDLAPPSYIKNSLKLELLKVGDTGASSNISGDERELLISWRVKEINQMGGGSPCYSALSFDDVFNSTSNGQRIYKNSSESYGPASLLAQPQSDGATHTCHSRHKVTRFWTSGAYYIPFIEFVDIARQGTPVRFSFRGKDPTIESAPEIPISSTNSDGVPPVLNIAACKTDDLTEKCLRVVAKPTNPQNPDGETVVDIYYWAYEDQPLSNASGFDGGMFHLRDPLGKTFQFYLDSGTAAGVIDRSPPRLIDGAVYFACPKVAPADCTSVTQVQYQARVILPKGSVPGMWGLYDFRLTDKARNARDYDFTELVRFTPLGSGDDERVSAFGDGASGNPFIFDVAGEGSKPPSISAVVISSARDALFAGISTTSNWISSAFAWMTNGIIRAANWVQGGVRSGVSLGRFEFGVESNDSASASRRREGLNSSEAATDEVDVVSIAEDPLTGSRYQVIREEKLDSDRQQGWKLQYRSSTDTLFVSKALPDTAEVLWRAPRSANALPTTAWTQVCSDRVWSVQDGYQVLFHVGDRSLSDLRPGQLWVNSQTEVTVIQNIRCAFGGAVWVEGYAFGANDREPLLRNERVTASRFVFGLNRYGVVTKRDVNSAPFDVVGLCAAPANEQQMFCSEAKKAVGW